MLDFSAYRMSIQVSLCGLQMTQLVIFYYEQQNKDRTNIVERLLVMLPFHIRYHSELTAQIPVYLLAKVPGRAVRNGPRLHVPGLHV